MREIDTNKLSNMMKEYVKTKLEYEDCVLFYRLGDFYEMFFDDAELCSRELELTLTGKDCGLDERAPMCGIPHHAASVYIEKLINKNYKVAICEQVGPIIKGKPVTREVVKIITPGTVFDPESLDETKNNFIASVYLSAQKAGVAWVDVSTGEFFTTSYEKDIRENISQFLNSVRPSEIICNNEALELNKLVPCILQGEIFPMQEYGEFNFGKNKATELCLDQFKIRDLKIYDLHDHPEALISVGAILSYLNKTQKQYLSHINRVKYIPNSGYLILDSTAMRNLELFETVLYRRKAGSLISVLDQTKTGMGARFMRNAMLKPLTNEALINERLEAVEELKSNQIRLSSLIDELKFVRDIERLTGKISSNTFMPRDALALLASLKQMPKISHILADCNSALISSCKSCLVGFDEVISLLDSAIDPNAPLTFKDGGYIKSSFNAELASYRDAKSEGSRWIQELLEVEKEKTGILKLKSGYNSNFGYYFEVLNSQKDLVPYRYIRKQTTINAERYITEELKELETKILSADENALKLELEIFKEIRNILIGFIEKFQELGHAIATIDFIQSLATVALKNNYVKPEITTDGTIEIESGRHPIVEASLKGVSFNPNSTLLDTENNKIMLITGPNMAGKSTYMRQVAIITLMAHLGSFVPATKAKISIVDRIFTRIGASDDLAFGQSTFMVEMVEVANIISNATPNSLVILDEVGRGTSTYDGLSIAKAIIEYFSTKLKAKTLFATHYHELVQLENSHSDIKNYSVAVKEFGGSIVFLHKIIRGGANKSFGIEVASLAGLPKDITNRAKDYLREIEDTSRLAQNITSSENKERILSLNETEALNAIKSTNLDMLSPMMALDFLNTLQNKLKEDK